MTETFDKPACDEPRLDRPALSAVVPCYNEENCIRQLYDRLAITCRAIVGDSYEIILTNDGSQDATWSIIEALSGADSHVVGVNLSRNHGHQIALTAGLTFATGDRIFIIDADLQDPPELLGDMMARMDEGADVVYGKRRSREGETTFKRMTATLFYRLMSRLSDVEIPVDSGDFRLMSRRAHDALMAMPETYRFVRGMVTWIGFRQEAIAYDRKSRFAGKSNYPLSRMLRLAFDAVTSFSIQPLRVASLLGFLLGLLSIPLVIYVLAGWLSGEAVPGWTSLMVVVLVLGSAQMMVLGMIGEYLGRTYVETKRRPLFLVQEVVAQRPYRQARIGRGAVVDNPHNAGAFDA